MQEETKKPFYKKPLAIIVAITLLSVISYLYTQYTQQQKPIDMNTNDICELPEDINILNQYIENKYGKKISIDRIEELKKQFDKSKDKVTSDKFGINKQTKIRYVLAGKMCTAKDGVRYIIRVVIVFSEEGKHIIHTPYLYYSQQTLVDKKRLLNLNHGRFVHQKTVEKVVKKYAVGIMNRSEFDKYIKSTGTTTVDEYINQLNKSIDRFGKLPYTNATRFKSKKIKDRKNKLINKKYRELKHKHQDIYFYPTEIVDATVRYGTPYAYLDMAQQVIVEYDKNSIVKKIIVSSR